MMENPIEISIVGTGYVGLVTGVCLAYLGHSVTCVDKDESKIDALCEGRSPIYEPGLDTLLQEGMASGRLRFTTDLALASRAEVVFIAVGTPPQDDGAPDLKFVQEVARTLGQAIRECDDGILRIVVNKSTVPVGSGNWVEMLVREGQRADAAAAGGPRRTNGLGGEVGRGGNFVVASNPEFLREGSAIHDTLYPDRIVIGASDRRAIDVLRAVYEPILSQQFTPPASIAPRPDGFGAVPLVVTDLQSAEMIKYAANAFLATKISFANEIANICERVGADVTEVTRAIGLDQRIGVRFLNAGIGWGGSCFGKDLSALIRVAGEYTYDPELLRAAVAVNARQRHVVIRKLQSALKIIKGRTIGLLGLAFKPETDDLRDAPSLTIAEALIAMGARVKAYDPVAMDACFEQNPELDLMYAESAEDLVAGCDAVVLVTEWEAFQRLDLSRVAELMAGDVFIDGRNVFDPEALARAGLRGEGIGR
jgi:UDPglucose 6-dehydrogenase